MVSVIDDRLRDEARRFRLVFACPDCASYDVDRDACSLGFPNAPHREPGLEGRATLEFCKAFELA